MESKKGYTNIEEFVVRAVEYNQEAGMIIKLLLL